MSPNKLLLHTCCGPCATVVNPWLVQEGYEVKNFFYNPNIHPWDEYVRRYQAFFLYLEKTGTNGIVPFPYQPQDYFQALSDTTKRCLSCYSLRLRITAWYGKQHQFEYFSTTLTVSPYQDVPAIHELGKQIARETGVCFIEKDFRSFYPESVARSNNLELYRQKYCGCLFSQWEGVKKREWKSLTGQKYS
ncbi:MAG: epoxyqueuosine reductase QueH [Candidatus Atribacteria bacterium]|nr:epoxyqueuosine reductase QueH [Candidatus Atribacteria bacterium]